MKIFNFINNRIFLKFVLIFLAVLWIGAILLYQSYKAETSIAHVETKNNSVEIKKNIKIADKLFDKPNYDSAYIYYKKAISLCDPIDNYVDDYVYSVLSIANLQQNTSDFAACEESISLAFPHLHKTSKPKYTYNAYTLLAYNYYFTYDNYNALLYHKKALKLATTPFKKSVILNDICLVYQNQKKFKEVIDILEPLAVRKIKHETDSTKTENEYSLLLNSLGFCYYQTGNPKALDCFKKSLAIQIKLKQDFELMSTYGNLAMYYSKHEPKLSKIYTEKQYEAACKANSASFKVYSLATLIKKSEGKELKQYSKAYLKIIDSVQTGIKNTKTQFSIIKNESKINKTTNLQLKAQQAENELQLERHKKRNIILYIVIIFILAILLFLSLYLSLKGKKEKKQAIMESEMRISNKLQNQLTREVYNTLIFAQKKDLGNVENKNQLLNNLDIIYSQTRDISRENSFIVTNENYNLGLKEMISGFKTPNLNLLINGLDSIKWNRVNKNKKIIIYRILQELLQNMKKHSNAALVIISFKMTEKNIAVIYSDNGTGTENEKIIFKNGLQNVENRTKTINGTINFDNNVERGFKVSFTFPL